MGRRNEKSLCESARDYCCDLLFPELAGEVPEQVRLHAAACPECRERLADVRQLLAVLGGPQLHEHLYARQLTRHFRLLGARVSCADVRQYLPLLADKSLLLKIPTPVTVHCDQCAQCSRDVSTIASLMLKGEQLARLSGLYSHEYKPRPEDCAISGDSIKTLADLDFEGIDSEAARHICTCRTCRTALYEERLRLKPESWPAAFPIPCAAVKPADMFDFVMPFGLDLHRLQYVKFTAVLAEHLRRCPTCRERMRQLHNIIYTIDSRGDSGVTTTYQFAPGKKQRAMTSVSEQYPTWPIKVHAAGPDFEKKQKLPIIANLTQKLTQNAPKPRRILHLIPSKKWLKPIGIAATIMLIASLFFIATPTSQAVTLADVYKAVGRALNVFVSTMQPGGTEPLEEEWVSQSRGLRLITNGKRFTLLDVQSGIVKYRSSENAAVRTAELSPDVLTRIEGQISQYGQIMPFADESKIPAGWRWEQVQDPAVTRLLPNTVVYDLTWREDSYRQRKWRGFIDIRTNLPKRREMYTKENGEENFVLTRITKIEYPSDAELQSALDAVLKIEPESGAAGIPPSIPALSP